MYQQLKIYCSLQNCIKHICISAVSFLKSETLPQLWPWLEKVYCHFRIYCICSIVPLYSTYFIPALSFFKFQALTTIVTLITRGVQLFRIFLLQLLNVMYRNWLQLSLLKGARQSFLNGQCSKQICISVPTILVFGLLHC